MTEGKELEKHSSRVEAIRAEAERVHESAQLSSETQFEYAKRWRRVDRWLGGVASILAGIPVRWRNGIPRER